MTHDRCFHCDERPAPNESVVRVLWRLERYLVHTRCLGDVALYLLLTEPAEYVEVTRA